MKRLVRFVATAALGLLFVAVAAADTLELKDGRILQGRYLGGTQAVLRFEIEGNVQAFSVNDVVAVTFTRGGGGGAAAAPTYAPAPAAAPVAQAQPIAAGGTVTIPAGQSILVRMIDGVDSSKNHVGDIFHASLETDLTVNGALVARKGTDVYGRLAEAKEAGHMAGSAELHQMVMDAGVMRMRAVAGVDVKPGDRLVLQPGGYHVMLEDLKRPLQAGDTFPLTLGFEKAGSIEVSVVVESMAAGAMHPHGAR